jgi:outer membrane protein
MQTRWYGLLLLCLAVLLALPAAAQPVKIGVINTLRLERESARPKRDAEMLKREFASREQTVREMHAKVLAMQADLDKLKPGAPDFDKRQRAFAEYAQQFEQIRRSFVEDVDRRRFEERQKFYADVAAVVEKIAKSQKFDLIVEETVYASRAVDITDQVIKALDAAGGAAKK